jgi:lipoate-protein ligase A
MGRFSDGLVHGLNSLSVSAEFRRKNDIEVNGRKIVGLGIYRAPTNGLLFHASLLVDLDVRLMLSVLNTPFEKISDKEIATVEGRMTTVRRESQAAISLDEVRERIADGFAAAFHVSLVPSHFTTEELESIAEVEGQKYRSDQWVFQTTAVPDTYGAAKVKTPAGLLDVRAALAGNTIKAVHIGGDFFSAENAIGALEASLRWHRAEPNAIAATLAEQYQRWASELSHIPLRDLTEAVQRAAQRARLADSRARADPYGCFVNPGGGG